LLVPPPELEMLAADVRLAGLLLLAALATGQRAR
jgi:hypothetical protein